MLSRLLALGILSLGLVGCREAPEPPPPSGTANDAATTPVELPADAVSADDGYVDEGAPGFSGATAPSVALDLRDGSVCYVYERYVVRAQPRGEAGDGVVGEDVYVVARAGDDSPRDLCESPDARLVTTESRPDVFVGVEEDLLLLVRNQAPSRKLLARDLADGDATVLDVVFEEPVQIEEGVLEFGALERRVRSASEVGEGVACPEAETFLESGLEIGVVRLVRFDLATKQSEETEERLCVPME